MKRILTVILIHPALPRESGFPPNDKGGQVRYTPTSSGEFKFKDGKDLNVQSQLNESRVCPRSKASWAKP
jgi:hypothetical protein